MRRCMDFFGCLSRGCMEFFLARTAVFKGISRLSGYGGVHQRANKAKPTQKAKASTAGTAPLVAKGMTRLRLNFFEMTKPTSPRAFTRTFRAHKPSIEFSTQPRDRTEGGAPPLTPSRA